MSPARRPEVASPDGRRARSERGRHAVIDATIDLIQSGADPLTADAVTQRAGVSVSSLFRYFENLHELQVLTIDRFIERYADAFDIPDLGRGPLPARVTGYVTARVSLYRTVAPMARLARRRAPELPAVRDLLHRMRCTQVDQAAEHFEIAPARAELIATLTSFESWDQLTTDHGRSDAEIAQRWGAALAALIAMDDSGLASRSASRPTT